MYEGHDRALALAAIGALPFDLQLFAEDDDPELGAALEIDVDALGDDPVKLKSMLGKALHENKKVRTQAGKRRIALREAETERDRIKGELDAAKSEEATLKEKIESANRANGQYRANFKAQLVDKELRAVLKEMGAIDIDLVAQAIARDQITCDDETFAVGNAKEVAEALKAERPHLFPTSGNGGTGGTGGTNRSGTGPGNGGTAGGKPTRVDYSDTSKSLDELERESNQQMFGRATIGGGV